MYTEEVWCSNVCKKSGSGSASINVVPVKILHHLNYIIIYYIIIIN